MLFIIGGISIMLCLFVWINQNNLMPAANKSKSIVQLLDTLDTKKMTICQTADTMGNMTNIAVGNQYLANPIVKQFIDAGLCDVQQKNNTLKVQLRYATNDNFAHKSLYGPLNKCFLHPQAAAKLQKAQDILQQQHPNYSLLLLDCARPHAIQKKMWDIVKNTPQRKYIAPPSTRSMHNYGMAVDITIVDVANNVELDMGTPYDYFGPKAQPRYEQQFLKEKQLTSQHLQNRHLLKNVMKQAGFRPILLEWWHFEASTKDYARKNCQLLP